MENSRDPGGGYSVDVVRVLEEGKGLLGGTQMVDENRVMDIKEGGDGKVDDKVSEVSVELDVDDNGERVKGANRKSGVEERMIGQDARGSWGVMELVGRVLDGNFGMEKEERDFKLLEDNTSGKCLVNLNVTRGAIGEAVSGNEFFNKGIGVDEILDEQNLDLHKEGAGQSGEAVSGNEFVSKGTRVDEILEEQILDLHREGTDLSGEAVTENEIGNDRTGDDKMLDEKNLDLHGEGTGLNGKDVVINEQVPDGSFRNSKVHNDKPGFLVPNKSGEGDALNGKQNVVVNEQVTDVISRNIVGEEEKPCFLMPKTRGEGSGLNGKENLVVNEHMSGVNYRNAEGHNGNQGLLMPKTRGEECITEKEGEYCVSDLVWGKVRSHPWWPGQVFEPSAASENAIKYLKRDSYLLAYFGDQTFAWNEGSKIKPFRMHFTQMEKQSNSIAFCHAVNCALDETARRVELGLSCSCLPEEVHYSIKTQMVANAGIREESSKRDDRDYLSGVTAFLPAELVRYLKVLAEAPKFTAEKLEFVIAKAQLLAFNRWKGRYQLPDLQEFGGLLEDDYHVTVLGSGRDSGEVMEGSLLGSKVADQSKRRKSIPQDGPSRKRKHLSSDDDWSLSSSRLPTGEKKSGRKSRKKIGTSGEKRERIDSISSNSNVEGRKRLLPNNYKTLSQPNSYLRVGERLCRALKSGDGSSTQSLRKSGGDRVTGVPFGLTPGSGKSQSEKLIPAECPPPHEIFSMLCMAAKNPMKKSCLLTSKVSLLCEFRNSTCLENDKAQNHEKHAEKHKEKLLSNSENADISGFEGIEDSYWTDRIIQSDPEEKMIYEPGIPIQKFVSAAETEAVLGTSAISDNKQERDAFILDSKIDNVSGLVDEKSLKYSPTALILNFTNLESIPSIANLNGIFSRYGPLSESDTEVFSKSKRVKVIFKNRDDAEAAFSSTGKYSIFGPSLVSYKLNYSPTLRKAPKTSRRNRKQISMKDGAV